MYERKESTHYKKLNDFLEIMRYEKSVVKYEDFIDDVYTYETTPTYKELIRKNANMSDLIDDYLKYKKFLVKKNLKFY